MQKHSIFQRFVIIVLLSALISAGSVSLGEAGDPPALVKVELSGEADLKEAAATGLPGIVQYARSGEVSLLVLADALEQADLAARGFQLHVMDPDSQSSVYYRISARTPEILEAAQSLVQFLEQDGRRAIVRADDAWQVEALLDLGIELERLVFPPLSLARVSEKSALGIPQSITPDPNIAFIISQVSPLSVSAYNGNLSGENPVMISGESYEIMTRYSRTVVPIEKATQYAYEHFLSLGLPTSFHTYNLPGTGDRRNVVAQQTGRTEPEKIVLVVAHLDSTSQSAYRDTLAPGADDNASGSVGVFVAADILSKYRFAYTIRYVLFTGEEQGLYGSEAYAAYVDGLNENIIAVLNMDMIGYNTLGSQPVIEVHTRPSNTADLAIANLFVDVIDAYALNLIPEVEQDAESASDHASFWNHGFPAVLAIEDFQDFTPYYHTIDDLRSTLDLEYFVRFVKASVGTTAHLSGLLPAVLTGQVTNTYTHDPVEGAAVEARMSTGLAWSTTTNAQGAYSLNVLGGLLTVRVNGPAPYLPFVNSVMVPAPGTTTYNVALQGCAPVQTLAFTYSPASPLVGETVVFTATVGGSTTPPVTYTWDFGDGTQGSGASVTHAYAFSSGASTYPVNLSAANLCSAAGPVEQVLLVDVMRIFLPWMSAGDQSSLK